MKRHVCLLGLLAAAAGAVSFPPPQQGLFYDGTGVVTSADRERIRSVASALRQATGDQLAVAVIPSLEGFPIEDYANRLFMDWGVGLKGKDNGVLILVALNDRKMRIEVGYGLEPILPDGLCGDIIRTQMRPAFAAGRYSEGVIAAADRIRAILQGQPGAATLSTPERAGSYEPPLIAIIALFSLFVLIGAFMLGAGLGSNATFPILFGLFFGGFPTLAGMAFLTVMHRTGPWLTLFPSMYAVMAAFAFRKARMSGGFFRATGNSYGGVSSSSGWSMGSSGGGMGGGSDSSGGGSSGGDSDGGGGGSSGGGGASGSW